MAACLGFLLFVYLSVTLAAQQCYFTDGSPANNDFPCVDNAGDSASPCCGAGNICLTNGLCFNGLTLNRGSCTDQSWNSNLCTQLCVDALYSGVWPCDDAGSYSCNFGDCSDAFTLTAGRLQLNTVLESSLGLDSPTATVTSSPNTATITTTLTPSASLAKAGGSSQGVSTGAAAGIGAGIGIPLLCATLAATILFFLERRKRRQLESSMQWTSEGQKGGYTAYKYVQGDETNEPPNRQAHEMDGLRPQELDNTRLVPELMDRSK